MLAQSKRLVGINDRGDEGDVDLWQRLRSLPVGVQLKRHLAGVPAFAGCRRSDLRRVARWGDLIEVEPGRDLLREDGGNFWFFVVLTGQVRLTRRGRPVATIGPGGHFGEWAVVGLHPQPATVTTADRSVLFVLGRRYVVSLLFNSPPFQRNLFPDVEPSEYSAFARHMHEQARLEWVRLAPPLDPPRLTSRQWLGARPGRALSIREAAAVLMKVPARSEPPRQQVSTTHRKRWTVGASAVIFSVLASVLFLYHPPRLVITPATPIDISGDITISGVPTHRPVGRYLLLLVHVHRPRLAGLLTAALRGEATIALDSYQSSRAGLESATRVGRQQYLDSQQEAIAAAVAAAGSDRGHLPVVVIRDRGLVGPSAGLVYALAVTDLLSRDGLSGGRVVAASGVLGPDGSVEPVGWIDLKAGEAARAHAAVLLVPAGQQGSIARSVPAVYGVSTLRQAIDLLEHQ